MLVSRGVVVCISLLSACVRTSRERVATTVPAEGVATRPGASRGVSVVSTAEAPHSAEAVVLRVGLGVARGGQFVPVALGTPLRSGERFILWVQSNRDSWLHAVQFFPDGTSMLLSSADGRAVFARAGERTRVPPGSHAFELDSSTGQENIYVVASTRPLAEVNDTVERLVDDIRVSGSRSAPDAHHGSAPRIRHADHRPPAGAPSDMLDGLSRGTRIVPEGDAAEGRSDERGLGVVRVSFQHTP